MIAWRLCVRLMRRPEIWPAGKAPMTPQQYGVRGIPTLILFKDGQVAATKVGALPKNQLADWIASVV